MTLRNSWLVISLLTISVSALAQLPNGSLAPNFNLVDINGVARNLYNTLDSGKIVILEISATWCPPCWSYHQSEALQDFYTAHGPAGDDQARVFWVEGDPNTNVNCIYGQPGCNDYSPGNYAAGVTYPLLNSAAIANLFQITYFPSIFIICPNRKVYETDALPADALWEKAQVCPIAYGAHNAGMFEYDPGYDFTEICGNNLLSPSFQLTNLGSEPLTNALLLLQWEGNTVQSIDWTGVLNTYEDTLIQFAPVEVQSPGALSTVISSINNNAGDDDFTDNYDNRSYTQALNFSDTRIVLKIRTDNYGEEIYWELRDELGNVLEHGGNQLVGPNGGGKFPLGVAPGPGAYPSNTLIKDTLDLPAGGCYSIHFVDGYGDGMCCQYGNGYFKLYNLSNPVIPLLSGGEFEALDQHAFSAGTLSSQAWEAHGLETLRLYPNPAQDWLNLEMYSVAGGTLQVLLFSATGQSTGIELIETVPSGSQVVQLPIAGLNAGFYWVKVSLQHQEGDIDTRMLKVLVEK